MKQLGRDSKYAPVYRLLEIFLTGRLADYLEFQAADASTLKNYGMRLMITSSLCLLSPFIPPWGRHILVTSFKFVCRTCARGMRHQDAAYVASGSCHFGFWGGHLRSHSRYPQGASVAVNTNNFMHVCLRHVDHFSTNVHESS